MPDEGQEPEDLDRPPSFFPYDESDDDGAQFVGSSEPVKVRVHAVVEANDQYFVILSDGRRELSIVIDRMQASSIVVALDEKQPDRPMTHDLIRTIVNRLGGSVEKVFIDDLWGSTYYAKIFFNHNREDFIIDSRPSDAVAIALRANAPIFVAEGILDQQGA